MQLRQVTSFVQCRTLFVPAANRGLSRHDSVMLVVVNCFMIFSARILGTVLCKKER